MDDSLPTGPQPSAAPVWVGSVLLVGLLIVAASSASVRVWTTPDTATQPAETSPVERLPVAIPSDPADSAAQVVGLIAALVIVALILLVLMSVLSRSPTVERLQRRAGWGRLTTSEVDPLPESRSQVPSVDLDAVRAALLDGDPRNGIVACWMELERRALDAGLPRLAAETAHEYSVRVVGASSVDPEPISELAELYREARFSGHRLGEQHRQLALAALTNVRHGLVMRETTSP